MVRRKKRGLFISGWLERRSVEGSGEIEGESRKKISADGGGVIYVSQRLGKQLALKALIQQSSRQDFKHLPFLDQAERCTI